MDISGLLFAAACSLANLLLLCGFFYLLRRRLHRSLERAIANSLTPDGRPIMQTEEKRALKPEADYVVNVSDAAVTCTHPDGAIEAVAWNEISKVEVLTTDEGPFSPDTFWVLHGTERGCVIPWGATGEKDLWTRFDDLPNFDWGVIVNAASLTTNQMLLCWENKGA